MRQILSRAGRNLKAWTASPQLGKLLSPFTQQNFVTGLEIGSHYLKVAQVEKGSRGPRIIKLWAEEFPSPSDEEISQAIRDLCKDLSLNSNHLVSSIPRGSVTIRYILLPSDKKAEIREVVQFQVSRQVPFNKEELVYDYKIIGSPQDGYSWVMLAIVQKKRVEESLRLLNDAGLQPEKIGITSEGLLDFYLAYVGSQDRATEGCIALLYVDLFSTSLELIDKGELVYTRSIPLGIHSLGQRNLSELLKEIRLSLKAYEKESRGEMPEKLVLNENALLPQLKRELKREFGLPVEVIEPLKEMGKAVPITWSRGISPLSTLGLAIGHPGKAMDLLPPEVKEKRRTRIKKRELIRMGLTWSLILAISLGLFSHKTSEQKAYLDHLTSQVELTEPLATKVELMKERVGLFQNQMDRRGSVLDALSELYRTIPHSISLRAFIYEKNRSVTLKGSAKALSDVFELIPKLEASPLFRGVAVKYASKRKMGKGELTDFQISFYVTKEGS